jgi:hypothetical protein
MTDQAVDDAWPDVRTRPFAPSETQWRTRWAPGPQTEAGQALPLAAPGRNPVPPRAGLSRLRLLGIQRVRAALLLAKR